jgi:hypothetical protein
MSHLDTSTDPANSSPAVEVIATLGDSVVGVRHVVDPRSGRTTTNTRILLGTGIALLVAGVISFFAATSIAASNASNLDAWLARGKPGWSFRPESVPLAMSIVSFFGIGIGLTALIAGLSRRKRELEPSTIAIGSAPGVDFAVAGTPTPNHALVSPEGDGFVLDVTGLTGDVSGTPFYGPQTTRVPVTMGMKARAQVGQTTFHVTAVEAPRRQTNPLIGLLDRRALTYVAASAAVHLALWAVSRTVPPTGSGIGIEVVAIEDTAIDSNMTENETKPPEPTEGSEGDAGGESSASPMLLTSGIKGVDKPIAGDPGRTKIKNNGPEDLARQRALEAAASIGVLSPSGDLFSTLVATGQVSSGFDDITFDGAFDGDGTGAPQGFGMGPNGFGPGGGGLSSYFRASYGKIPNGSRIGQDYLFGGGRCRGRICGGRDVSVPPVRIGTPVTAGYDKSIVRRYVRRALPKISYCYEKQLLAKPSLAGTVMATWIISPDGSVTNSSASGVDAEVSSCIANVISAISFPKPPAAGVFQIKYPFELRPTGTGR